MTRILRRQGQVFERRSPAEQQAVVNQMVHPAAQAGEMVYDQGTGQGATPVVVRDYQREGQDRLGGYIGNPFEEEGRERMGRQFWEAPLGGHVRSVLEGQELFGHRITRGQARMAEQAAGGLLATGVGVPSFLAAVNQLTTPQNPEVIPM